MAAERRTFPTRTFLAGPVAGLAGWIGLHLPDASGHVLLVSGALLVAGPGVSVALVVRWFRRTRLGLRASARRSERKAQRTGGTASRWDHVRHTSRLAMLLQARHLRPSLDALPWWRLLRVPTSEYAARLGRDQNGPYWVNSESVVVRLAGARSGKTTAMADRVIDHPGPAVVTSTRKDLLLLTAQLRARRGDLLVFNPAGVGAIASSLKWSPVSGCTDMSTAERRAGDLIPPAQTEERESWNTQARRVLAPLLYAAAHANLPARAVLAWVAATGADQAKRYWTQIQDILKETPDGSGQRENLAQFFGMAGANDRTRSSIVTTLMPSLAWLGNPQVAAIGDAQGDDLFDVRAFLRGQGTLYLLGADTGATGPLTAALVADLAYQAAQLAEELPGGRLDPALLLALDEAALVCPGPIPRWTMDMGGRAILLDISAQSRAVLDQFWGVTGRQIILGNAGVTLVGPGCSDPDELDHWERLAGLRTEVEELRDQEGRVTSRNRHRVPVLPRAEIARLRTGRAVAFARHGVTILDTPKVRRRRDLRKAGAYQPVTETRYAGRPMADDLAGEG